ncbi:MAG: MFS transporter [Beijerinckiaceae bacterium]
MTTERPPTLDAAPAAPELLPPAERARIFLYMGGLIVLLAFADPNGGLMDIPVSFFLKNKLHLEASEVATFRLLAAIPLYFSFLFGFARDRWVLSGRSDRGLILLCACSAVALYLLFAGAGISYGALLAAMMLLTCVFLFIAAAQSGLMSSLGQQHAMTGQASATSNISATLPAVAALLVGGSFSQYLESHDASQATTMLFLAGAAVSTLVAAYALLRPQSVFGDEKTARPERPHFMEDLRRLARSRAIRPALAIWLLWNFAPGSTTPLQYHLQNALHAPDSVWGAWNAIFAASFIPTFIAYAWLCQRVALKKLLWIGTLIAIPQFVPLLFVQSSTGALIAAIPIGLLGGLSTGAYFDLIMRACPPGLQGTVMMFSTGLYFVSSRFGDVLGTRLYDHFGGFGICVAMITIVYASILLVLPRIPDALVSYADGVSPPK